MLLVSCMKKATNSDTASLFGNTIGLQHTYYSLLSKPIGLQVSPAGDQTIHIFGFGHDDLPL